MSAILSAFLGYVSMGCWVVATVPQILENYYNQSTDGLAPAFVLIWVAGDVLNLIGSWWQNLLRSMILLAAYYVSQDLILLYQILYYSGTSLPKEALERAECEALLPRSRSPSPARPSKSSSSIQNIALTVFVLVFGVLGTFLDHAAATGEEDTTLIFGAQIVGYTSMTLYLFARVPQIVKNRATHCEGLAPGMFILSAVANTTYLCSILAKSLEPEYLRINLSWIIGSGGCVFLDFIVLAQFALYSPL